MERVQSLLEQLAQDNQVTVDDVMKDLQRRIDEAWAAEDETEDSLLHSFFRSQKPCPGMKNRWGRRWRPRRKSTIRFRKFSKR